VISQKTVFDEILHDDTLLVHHCSPAVQKLKLFYSPVMRLTAVLNSVEYNNSAAIGPILTNFGTMMCIGLPNPTGY